MRNCAAAVSLREIKLLGKLTANDNGDVDEMMTPGRTATILLFYGDASFYNNFFAEGRASFDGNYGLAWEEANFFQECPV